MDLIDEKGNVNGHFVAGNPETGVTPTGVNARWLEAIQMEIANAIEAAEIELDIDDNTQLSQAIQAIVARYGGGAGGGSTYVVSVSIQAPLQTITGSQVTFTAYPEMLLNNTSFGKCKWTDSTGAVINDADGNPEEGLSITRTVSGGEGDTHAVTCVAYDNFGNASAPVSRSVEATLNNPPDVSGASITGLPDVMYKNSSYPFTINGVTDADGDPLTITATVTDADGNAVSELTFSSLAQGADAAQGDTGDITTETAANITFTASDGRGGVAVIGPVPVTLKAELILTGTTWEGWSVFRNGKGVYKINTHPWTQFVQNMLLPKTNKAEVIVVGGGGKWGGGAILSGGNTIGRSMLSSTSDQSSSFGAIVTATGGGSGSRVGVATGGDENYNGYPGGSYSNPDYGPLTAGQPRSPDGADTEISELDGNGIIGDGSAGVYGNGGSGGGGGYHSQDAYYQNGAGGGVGVKHHIDLAELDEITIRVGIATGSSKRGGGGAIIILWDYDENGDIDLSTESIRGRM